MPLIARAASSRNDHDDHDDDNIIMVIKRPFVAGTLLLLRHYFSPFLCLVHRPFVAVRYAFLAVFTLVV